MLQGDEPMTTPEMINMAVQPLLNDSKSEVGSLNPSYYCTFF